MTNVLGRILAICLGLVTACYSPPQPDCGFQCGQGQTCPSDYFCAPDGVCKRNGTPPTALCPTTADARIDTPPPIDAPPADADITPPQLFDMNPMPGAMNVSRSVVVQVQFNEPVGNVTLTSFYLQDGSTNIPGTVSMIDPLNKAFTPSSLLPANTMITVFLTSAITDMSGNMFAGFMYSFTTEP